MKNRCKEKFLNGESVIGSFLHLGSSNVVECMGLAGLDFVMFDAEHGPFETESIADYIRAAKLRDITPMVRCKDCSRSAIIKMLDIGAEALVVPNINSVEEVKNLIEYGKYFPVGKRGIAFTRNSGWGTDEFARDLTSYITTCNRETMLIPQCETVGCLENIEEIANVPGIDGIFIGPFDLSSAIGKPGIFDEAFMAAVKRIIAACRAAEKPVWTYAADIKQAKAYLAAGYSGIAVNSDAYFLINAYKEMVHQIKG